MSESSPPKKIRQATLGSYFTVGELRQYSTAEDPGVAESQAPSEPTGAAAAAAAVSPFEAGVTGDPDSLSTLVAEEGSQQQEEGSQQQARALSNMTVPRSALRTAIDGCIWLKTAYQDGNSNHFNFVEMPIVPGEVPKPRANSGSNVAVDRWDQEHVRLPCSEKNLYPVEEAESGNTSLQKRWYMIEKSLLQPMTSSYDLEEAIVTYNARYDNKWDFKLLQQLFQEALPAEQTQEYLTRVIPNMTKLALSLPGLVLQPLPLLKQQMNASITLSQHQVSSLLANAFFCTFPRRNATQKQSEYSAYPSINMSGLFGQAVGRRQESTLNKLQCILHYFKRVTQMTPTGCITYSRRVASSSPCWASSTTQLTSLHVSTSGVIEDAHGMLQVDFANKFVGGGVLRHGCVQEEIRFAVCPELILARLFTECLEDNECLLIHGAERYCRYTGYSDSFKFAGDYDDQTPRDSLGRRLTSIVAMDATHFASRSKQFSMESVARELNKAYCGFRADPSSQYDRLPAVATGNWGCGAFHGDRELKVLIQLMAAAEAGREVCYFTFGDERLRASIEEVYNLLVASRQSVGGVWNLISQYCSAFATSESPNTPSAADDGLFTFITEHLAQADGKPLSGSPNHQAQTQSI